MQRIANNRPILISGNFNAEPIEPVYSTVINYAPLKLSSAYADLLATMSSNVNDQKDTENDGGCNDETNNGDSIIDYAEKHCEQLIKNEPPYTTWKVREEGEVCHTIDYIFYSRDKLKVTNFLLLKLTF